MRLSPNAALCNSLSVVLCSKMGGYGYDGILSLCDSAVIAHLNFTLNLKLCRIFMAVHNLAAMLDDN